MIRRGLATAALGLGLVVSSRAASFPPAKFRAGVVACPHEAAGAAGVEVLEAGGDAADAAVAVLAALGAATPGSSGLGGGFFALVYRADERRAYVLDAREVAPAAARPDMFLVGGRPRPDLSRWGGKAVAVPGEVRGYEALHSRWGKLGWERLFGPAAALAQRGVTAGDFLVSLVGRVRGELRRFPQLARLLRRRAGRLEAGERFASPADQRALRRDGRWIRRGERLENPGLATTLRRLGRRGPGWFYEGALAAEIAAAARGHGGVLTAADLRGYRVTWREPLRGRFRDLEVLSMPPPSSGGVALLEALRVLEHFPLGDLGRNSSAYLHVLAEVLKHVFADRSAHLGDPAGARVPAAALLSPAHARGIARAIHPLRTRPVDRYARPLPADGGTNHVVVVDAAGNIVSASATLNNAFGSLVAVPGRGFVLNNQMDGFAIAPGVPGADGLTGGDANAPGPGKKPLSSMSPTIALRGGRPVLALGGAGGPKIISGVLQVLLNLSVFGDDVQAALDAPRIHHQWVPDRLRVEDALPREVREALGFRGHSVEVTRSLENRVQAVAFAPGGVREAACDPREGGRPVGSDPRGAVRGPGATGPDVAPAAGSTPIPGPGSRVREAIPVPAVVPAGRAGRGGR